MRYFAHLLGYFSQKEGNIAQECLYQDHYHYHFYYFEDLALDFSLDGCPFRYQCHGVGLHGMEITGNPIHSKNELPYFSIRLTSVTHSLDPWTSSSSSRVICVGETLSKTSPMTMHWGNITWVTHTSLPVPLPNPIGLGLLLGILGLGISVTNKGVCVLEVAVCN